MKVVISEDNESDVWSELHDIWRGWKWSLKKMKNMSEEDDTDDVWRRWKVVSEENDNGYFWRGWWIKSENDHGDVLRGWKWYLKTMTVVISEEDDNDNIWRGWPCWYLKRMKLILEENDWWYLRELSNNNRIIKKQERCSWWHIKRPEED